MSADPRPDAPARRAYWAQQLDRSAAFMTQVRERTVRECGEPVVALPQAAREAGVELRFSEKPYATGVQRVHVLRSGLIEPFLAAARAMNDRGWVLRVEDAYRTKATQRGLAVQMLPVVLERTVWELEGARPSAELMVRRLAGIVAAMPKTAGHMAAAALDVSVLDRATGAEVDRGAPYLEVSELTPMGTPFASAPARRAREEIVELMAAHGFATYPYEFWHFSRGDAFAEVASGTARAAVYGPVDLGPEGSVAPVADVQEPLNTPEEIDRLVAAALGAPAGRTGGDDR